MSWKDFKLGFTRKPTYLRRVLAGQGFKPKWRSEGTADVRMDVYAFFEEGRSKNEIQFTYAHQAFEDFWEGVANPGEIVAEGTLRRYAYGSDFDARKQNEVAKFLRDHYGAVLYDPQTRQVVTD